MIVEPKVCIPSCPRPPPTKEEMEDWIRIGKVISLVQTCSQDLSSKSLRLRVLFVVHSNSTKMSDFILHNYDIYAVAQFYPWFQLYFLLFQTHYHILPYPTMKEKKLKPWIKLNHNIYSCTYMRTKNKEAFGSKLYD